MIISRLAGLNNMRTGSGSVAADMGVNALGNLRYLHLLVAQTSSNHITYSGVRSGGVQVSIGFMHRCHMAKTGVLFYFIYLFFFLFPENEKWFYKREAVNNG